MRDTPTSMREYEVASNGLPPVLPSVGWRPRDGQHNFKVASWQAGVTKLLAKRLSPYASRSVDVYAFGVYTGMGLRKIADTLPAFGHLWAFDSFMGLPSEPKSESHWSPYFREGGYSAADAYNEHNLSALVAQVHTLVRRPNTTYIPGWYNESLTPQLLRRYSFQPALLVDIDCDLFSSAFQALDWMLTSRLLVPSSIVRYDDWPVWNATRGDARGTTDYGESKAHRLITALHNITWRRIQPEWQNAYQVRKL